MSDLTNSKYVGTWKPVTIELFGKKDNFESDSRLEIKADGTALMYSVNEADEDKKAYVWKETDYGIFLDGKHDFKIKAEGDTLYLKFLGVTFGYVKES